MVNIIAAVSMDGYVGDHNNSIPWLTEYPQDLAWFRFLTIGGVVVMGRNTWRALGRALPGRDNIVISGTSSKYPDGIKHMWALDIKRIQHEHPGKEIWLIGGEKLWGSALEKNLVDTIYISRLPVRIGEHVGQAIFPTLDLTRWQCKATLVYTNYTIEKLQRRDNGC